MRLNFKKYIIGAGLFASVASFTSCEKFLTREPLDEITPAEYFKSESDLEAYSLGCYSFSAAYMYTYTMGPGVTGDYHSDNIASRTYSLTTWVPGQKLTSSTGSDAGWTWTNIRTVNYFFDRVLPMYENGEISGSDAAIQHYIGEVYFMRAKNYFGKLTSFGDLPIVTEYLEDDRDLLIAASERSPRNEVARFILEDLDKAIDMLQETHSNKNRITRNVALQMKARVALYEATWLKYHAGTEYVPGGPGWPGADMDYNAGFSIDLNSEIDFFLTEAMVASKEVADACPLASNSGIMNPQGDGKYSGYNDYWDLFGADDLSKYDEILMWKDYDSDLTNLANIIPSYIYNGGGCGYTKSAVDTYLMKNGLPIYAAGSGYLGDSNLDIVKEDRDERLQLFVFGSSDVLAADPAYNYTYDAPLFFAADANNDCTGYRNRKYHNYDPSYSGPSGNSGSTGSGAYPLFRSVESYLIYMEASYLKNGTIDATASGYWKAIRARAGVDTDFEATIIATDLTQEYDWAVYSGGEMVDATLYNIRRERRLELMAEAFRWDDLKRWRSLDQVGTTQTYVAQGCNLWDELYQNAAYGTDGSSFIQADAASGTPNISAKSDTYAEGKYVLPDRRIQTSNLVWDGYIWSEANYLNPLPIDEMVLTVDVADDGSYNIYDTPLYQNPNWPYVAGMPATNL